MVKRIRKWFNDGCPFYEGVAIYRQTGGPYSLSMFEGYLQAPWVPSDIEQHLKYALECYLEANAGDQEDPEPEQSPEGHPNQPINQSTHTQTTEPQAIQNLRRSAIPLHKRQAMLHTELRICDDESTRYGIAREIMEEVIPELDGIYDRIREWEETGELPSEASTLTVVQDTVRKMQRVNSINSRISRLNGFLKKQNLSAGDRKKYEKEKLEKDLELAELSRELGL